MNKVAILAIQDRGKFCRLWKIWIRIPNHFCRKAFKRVNKPTKCTKTIQRVFEPSFMCKEGILGLILPQNIAKFLWNPQQDRGSITPFFMSAPMKKSFYCIVENCKRVEVHIEKDMFRPRYYKAGWNVRGRMANRYETSFNSVSFYVIQLSATCVNNVWQK